MLLGGAKILAMLTAVTALAPPPRGQRGDLELARVVTQRVRADGLIRIRDLWVVSRRGVVDLGGRAADLRSRDRAHAVAELTAGVRGVRGLLKVAPGSWSDGELLLMVQGRLQLQPALSGTPMSVTVDRGTVTLVGTVRRPQDRRLAEAVARSVRGVLAVANRIELIEGGAAVEEPPERAGEVTSFDISNDVGLVLLTDPILSERRISYSVEEGAVRLIGRVEHPDERHLAEALISEIAGVATVDNRLEVHCTAGRCLD